MQKKSRRPREKVLSMALMLVMLVLGILCFLTPLSTLVGVQYLAFGCLAIYGAVMVVRYIGSEHKSKFLLLGGVACFLLSAAVLLVWMFQSAEAAEGMMSFICCIVLAVLSVSMGINHFMMAFPFQRKDDKARGWLFAGAIVNFFSRRFAGAISCLCRNAPNFRAPWNLSAVRRHHNFARALDSFL